MALTALVKSIMTFLLAPTAISALAFRKMSFILSNHCQSTLTYNNSSDKGRSRGSKVNEGSNNSKLRLRALSVDEMDFHRIITTVNSMLGRSMKMELRHAEDIIRGSVENTGGNSGGKLKRVSEVFQGTSRGRVGNSRVKASRVVKDTSQSFSKVNGLRLDCNAEINIS